MRRVAGRESAGAGRAARHGDSPTIAFCAARAARAHAVGDVPRTVPATPSTGLMQGMVTVPAFWQQCLDVFRRELTPQQFNTWILPLAVEAAGGGYRVVAPNPFVLQWVNE